MTHQLADAAFWAGLNDKEALVEVAPDGAARRFSFNDLKNHSDAVAAHLISSGVKAGDCVTLVGDNSVEHVIAFLGVLKAGAINCLVNTKLSPADRQALIDETDSVFTLGDARFLTDGSGLDLANLLNLPKGRAPPPNLAEEALAAIMFTSGSSGAPKGVPITHSGYSWALEQFTGLAKTMAGKTGIVAAPLFHMNGQFHLLNM
ncbi:MAG: AMP-binding protein, partial [Pseudomonadota bacterium]